MKTLKKGTPVCVLKDAHEKAVIGIFHSQSRNGKNRLIEINGKQLSILQSWEVTPLTISEYIEHVMAPQGWLWDGDKTCYRYYNGSYEEKRVIINYSENKALLYIEDNMPSIDDIVFGIINQGREHLNKLNLLKELEV